MRPAQTGDISIMLRSSLRKQRRVLKDEQKKRIEDSTSGVLSSPLHTFLLVHTFLVCSMKEGLDSNIFVSSELKQFQRFLDGLEISYGSEAVTFLLHLLHFTHGGLSCSTLNKISNVKFHMKQSTRTIVAILSELANFLSIRWINAIPHYKLKYPNLSTEIQKYGDAADCYENIMEIISVPSDEESTKTEAKCEKKSRNYKELLLTMIEMGELDTLLFDHVFSLRHLSEMLNAFGVFSLLHILELVELKEDGDKDIACLISILKELSPLLSMSPDHFMEQFHVRSIHGLLKIPNNCAKMRTLLKTDKETTFPYLVPTTTTPLELKSPSNKFDQEKHVIKLRTMKDDSCHVISLSQSELKVWNIYSRECVRTFESLKEPKDVQMLDNIHAVVLCGRELIIYNLDNGKLKTKLKGMLNVKMPYFGIHDSENVMALSRNRMCANMINTETGDMVATFKVKNVHVKISCCFESRWGNLLEN